MKNLIKKTFYIAITGVFLFPISIVFAQPGTQPGGNTGNPSSGSSGLDNPLGLDDFKEIVAAILKVVVTVGTVIVVLAIIWAGFKFVTAQGNESKIEEAKKTFFWVVVGAIVLLGAQILSNVIVNTAKGLGVTGL